jgi:glutamate formiminotransferase/formiminotetrahydrofolate cyclodeaminase
MLQRVVECVPNFSEGRDLNKLKIITDAIVSVTGITLLDVDPGADMNRTVVTFLGDPEAVLEAAFRAVKIAAQVIDMSTQSGSHPRMGATDVCPFVPVANVTLDECAELAKRLGERVGRELDIPVYLYEHAASCPERCNLAVVRKGEYEGLAEKLKDPQWRPDFGPTRLHKQAGALITGAREFLIAYNITLNSRDKAHATDIAFELREKGRVARRGQKNAFYSSGKELFYKDGCFPCGNCHFDACTFEQLESHCREHHNYDLSHLLDLNGISVKDGVIGKRAYKSGLFANCKAIGWYVDAYKRAQLSINLTNYKITPIESVLEAARKMAVDRGLVVTGSEIVGLVPFQALLAAGQFYLGKQGKSPFIPVADILENAVFSMGLADVSTFEINKKVLGLPNRLDGVLTSMTCFDLIDEVSRDTPAPGGGSIAALAGSLGAGLASMVANLTHGKASKTKDVETTMLQIAERSQALKDRLLLAVDDDTNAFNSYMQARRLPKNTIAEIAVRDASMQQGLKLAVEVPWNTAKACYEVMQAASLAVSFGNLASITDAMVGVQMGFAGLRGGIWNVLINLKDITDMNFNADMESQCARLLADATKLLDDTMTHGDGQLAKMLINKINK